MKKESKEALERLRIAALNLATGFLIILITVSIEPLIPPPSDETHWLLDLGWTGLGTIFAISLVFLTSWSAVILIKELISFAMDDQENFF
jgi:hypothetical protein